MAMDEEKLVMGRTEVKRRTEGKGKEQGKNGVGRENVERDEMVKDVRGRDY